VNADQISALYGIEVHLNALAQAQARLGHALDFSGGSTLSRGDVLCMGEEIAGHGQVVLDLVRRVVLVRRGLQSRPPVSVSAPVPLDMANIRFTHSAVRSVVTPPRADDPDMLLLDQAWGLR
jgi:hypothetical protein